MFPVRKDPNDPLPRIALVGKTGKVNQEATENAWPYRLPADVRDGPRHNSGTVKGASIYWTIGA